MHHVVLIEDDALVRMLLAKRLEAAGWSVTALRDARGLDALLADRPADLIVADLGLPYLDGLAVVEGVRARGLSVPVLVLTAYDLPHLEEAVRGAGADDLVRKPYDQDDLVERMRRLMAA